MKIIHLILFGDEKFEIFLSDENLVVANVVESTDRREAIRLLDCLDRLMYSSGVLWNELSGVCVAYGRGSFTSNRIGAVTANTLAYIFEIPVFGFDASSPSDRSQVLLKSQMIDEALKFFQSDECRISEWVDPSYEAPPRINLRVTA